MGKKIVFIVAIIAAMLCACSTTGKNTEMAGAEATNNAKVTKGAQRSAELIEWMIEVEGAGKTEFTNVDYSTLQTVEIDVVKKDKRRIQDG
jgi:hypothetical protein